MVTLQTAKTKQIALDLSIAEEELNLPNVMLIEEIEFISDNYLVGKSAEQTRKNYRVTKIKSHLIFYRKIENEIVEIVRILHQRMEIKKRLK